jgi:hypothetical protein
MAEPGARLYRSIGWIVAGLAVVEAALALIGP